MKKSNKKLGQIPLERKCIRGDVEASTRLFRNITEIIKKLEIQKNQAVTIMDIFNHAGEALRIKLKDYCEKLMITDPLRHVQKVEEILWRKGFYDVITVAKKLKQKNPWTEKEKAFMTNHFVEGIGYYSYLVLNLQEIFDLKLKGTVDFSYCVHQTAISKLEEKGCSSNYSQEEKNCVTRFIHRCLICLGDLARYKLDFDTDWDSEIAVRYYKLAIALNPDFGMPHNQLGTIFSNKNYGLDTVYHYMRSLLSSEPFESAEVNFKKAVAMYSAAKVENSKVHSCVNKLLVLLKLWDDAISKNLRIAQESQILLNNFEECLNYDKLEKTCANENDKQDNFEQNKADFLTNTVIFKMFMICMMKIQIIEAQKSEECGSIIALIVSMLSQLVNFIIRRLHKLILNATIDDTNVAGIKSSPTAETINSDNFDSDADKSANVNEATSANKSTKKYKNLLKKLRRRQKQGSSSDSEDFEKEQNMTSSSDEMNSDNAESGGVPTEDEYFSDEYSNEEGSILKESINLPNPNNEEKTNESKDNDNQEKSVTASGVITEKKIGCENIVPMEWGSSSHNIERGKEFCDPVKIINILQSEKNLVPIKICCDWLTSRPEIIESCAKGSQPLMKSLVTLLNFLNVDFEFVIKTYARNFHIFTDYNLILQIVKTTPLAEEIDLRGLELFDSLYKDLDWDVLMVKKCDNFEETMLRCLKIVQFGHYLSSMAESGIKFDETSKLFILTQENSQIEKREDRTMNQSKGQLMRHMGKLWLKAEVRALETRVYSRLMSPYLVPDHKAFSKHMSLLKNLVYSKKFVVVIPLVVVNALDVIKKSSIQAREAIRWLEEQLKRGSRFLRFQRPHETLSLPYIKAPKCKDKEAWLYFQIIECCHYLAQQNTSDANDTPFVTLLTGTENKVDFTFNIEGLAKTAGVNFEHINAFHARWKSSKCRK